jgi:hypothetical protein
MPDVPLTFEGRCHCGAIGFVFRASQSPDKWTVRACQCTFCRGHGARTVTDPKGSITFQISEPSMLKRYRFGTRSSDFLICRDCGVYVAAVITSSKGQFATLNINTIRVPLEVPQAVPVSYDQENAGERLSRREQRWTPVVQQ